VYDMRKLIFVVFPLVFLVVTLVFAYLLNTPSTESNSSYTNTTTTKNLSPELVTDSLFECIRKNDPNPGVCVAELLLQESSDPETLVSLVYSWNEKDDTTNTMCHSIAHYLGRSFVDGPDIDHLTPLDNGRCDSGFIHGVVEALAFVEEDSIFYNAIHNVCNNLNLSSSSRYECIHGVGHAMAIRKPAPFVEMANYCSIFEEPDHSSCYTAILMAYSTDNASLAEDVQVEVPRLDIEEIPKVCSSVPVGAVDKCWQGLWQLYPRSSPQVLLELLPQACKKTPSERARISCGSSIGEMLFQIDPAGPDPESILAAGLRAVEQCPKDDLESSCLEGIAKTSRAWWRALHASDNNFISICDALENLDKRVCETN